MAISAASSAAEEISLGLPEPLDELLGFLGGPRKASWEKSVLGVDEVTVLIISLLACCTGLTGSLAVGGDSTWHKAELGAMVQMSAEGGGDTGGITTGGRK
ncbi:hypothetical protein D3C81_1987410 [compost metagenome]